MLALQGGLHRLPDLSAPLAPGGDWGGGAIQSRRHFAHSSVSSGRFRPGVTQPGPRPHVCCRAMATRHSRPAAASRDGRVPLPHADCM